MSRLAGDLDRGRPGFLVGSTGDASAFNPGGLSCGANPGSPITPDDEAPFKFTGAPQRHALDLSGDLITDTEAEMRIAMGRQ